MIIDIKLWLFVSLIVTAFLFCAPSVVEATKKNCGSTDDCPLYKKPICVLDMKRTCFRWFSSPCYMDIHICEHNKAYKIFHDKYCGIDNFMCNDEFNIYEEHYEENENLDKIIHSIYEIDN